MWSDKPCSLSNEWCRYKDPRDCLLLELQCQIFLEYELLTGVTIWLCRFLFVVLQCISHCQYYVPPSPFWQKKLNNTGTLNACKNLIMLRSSLSLFAKLKIVVVRPECMLWHCSVSRVENVAPWDLINTHFISTMWHSLAMFYASVILLVGWHTARPPLTIWLKASVARGHVLPYGALVAVGVELSSMQLLMLCHW